jgi:N-methylhydantoinase B
MSKMSTAKTSTAKAATDFNDPINLQVMWNRLIFIADQADTVLGRTAFSPIVRENHDYVTVLLDSRGRALAQCTWSIPVFITSLPVAAQTYFLPKFPPETLQEGDVLATNDPEIGTGHLPDVTMITPIFKNGKSSPMPARSRICPISGARRCIRKPATSMRKASAFRS